MHTASSELKPQNELALSNVRHSASIPAPGAYTRDAQAYAQSDFGVPGDPGLNVLSCNQIDVAIATTSTTPVSLSGNAWDHVPPSELIGTMVPQGTDVARANAGVAAVSASDASLARDACL